MGLDMYLTKKIYIGSSFKHREVVVDINITIGGKAVTIDLDNISEITEGAGYWRKAYAIHNWFVDQVQGGVDECQETYVSVEDLKRLRDECSKVLDFKDKADEILPTQEGFFCGSVNYDEWYFQDLEDTIVIVDKIIADNAVENGMNSYYYQSSW